jgi:integrase
MQVDLCGIDQRLKKVRHSLANTDYEKKKSALQCQFEDFLQSLPGHPTIVSASSTDVCRFLVWKDASGKTPVHERNCPQLGSPPKLATCKCPRRLASGTVESYVGQLRSLFVKNGRPDIPTLGLENPAASKEVTDYIKAIRLEQSASHVHPMQAVPLFPDKLAKISAYLSERRNDHTLPITRRFVVCRDKAFFLLQFFAGDRAGDLGKMLTQEIKCFPDGSGFLITHTVGKVLAGKSHVNTFAVMRCQDENLCAVKAITDYINFAMVFGVHLKAGYLFRPISDDGRVLDSPLPYTAIYMRLKLYLQALNIDDGETPHSFRSGCAIAMVLSGSAETSQEVMQHVGWFTKESMDHYIRSARLQDTATLGTRFSSAISSSNASQIRDFYSSKVDIRNFPVAF